MPPFSLDDLVTSQKDPRGAKKALPFSGNSSLECFWREKTPVSIKACETRAF